jgi:RHS repeat-associated protein
MRRLARVAATWCIAAVLGLALLTSLAPPAKADVWTGGGAQGSDACAMAIVSHSVTYYWDTSAYVGCTVGQSSGWTTAHFVNYYGISVWLACDPGFATTGGSGSICIRTAPEPPCPACVGDPVDALTGRLYETAVDYQSAGPFPLRFERSYSTNPRTALFSTSMLQPGPTGASGYWRSNLEAAMYNFYGAGTWPHALYFVLPGNRQLAFVDPNGTGNYVPMTYTSGNTMAPSVGSKLSLTWDVPSATATLTDSDGTQYHFRYNTSGSYASNNSADNTQLATINYRGGYVQTLSYDASSGYLTGVTDNLGRSLGFQYGANGQLTTLTANGATVATYTYISKIDTTTLSPYFPSGIPANILGQSAVLGSVTLTATGETTAYAYADSANPFALTSVTDARGNVYSTWTYDSQGRVVSNTLAGGVGSTTIAYNANGTTTVTNPLGEQKIFSTTLSTNNNVLLTQIQGQAIGSLPVSTTSLQYDANDFVSQVTDAAGRLTSYVNDPTTGLPTSITRGAGSPSAATSTYTWNAQWRVPTQAVEPGRTTAYVWSASGQLTSKTETDTTTTSTPYSTNGQTRAWTYAYGSNNLLSSVTDPAGGAVAYAYNSTGFIQTITDQMSHVTTVTAWNSRGEPTSITDPNSVVDTLGYDGDGRLTSVTIDSTGTPATTTIAYDGVGEITKITDPIGAWTSFTYDAARRLVGMANADGDSATYTRDAMGNATAVSLTSGATGTVAFSKTQAFDQLGRLIQSIGVSSQTYAFGYDLTDNLTSVTDPASHVFSNGFDALSRLISQTNEDGATVNLTRNGVDAITAYQDPRSLATSYVRNGFGEVIQEVSPDRGATTYWRDGRGLVTYKTDARGVSFAYFYDAAWRLTGKQNYANANDNVWYVWDEPASGSQAIGHITTVYDASGMLGRFYDAEGNVWQESRQTGSAPWLSIGFGHDGAGYLEEMFLPSGRHVVWNRDAMGRVTQVALQGGAGFPNWVDVVNPIAYNPYGRPSSLTFGNGLVETYGVDTDYHITSVKLAPASGSALINRTLSWTGEELNSIADAVTPADSETFTYTNSHRLASATGAYGSLSWTYDAVGNRTSQVVGSATQTYAYPTTSNMLSSITQSGVSTRNFTYDAAGDRITDVAGSSSLGETYDGHGQLASFVNGSSTNGTYAYDGFGRLTQRVVSNVSPAGTTQYLYDPQGHLILETDQNGNSLREYIWLDDMPVAIIDQVNTANPVLYYVHADHLDRPIMVTDANGASVWNAIWTPFGAPDSITGSLTYNARFPGQWFQIESGLNWNWHRHYDPSTGRYLQPDPLGLATLLSDGPSAYGYVRQSPLAWKDPTGQTAAGALAGAQWGAGVAGGLGIETGPGDIPFALLGAAAGAAIGDWWTGPDDPYTVLSKSTESKPTDCPSGTRPINKDPRTQNVDHGELKGNVGAGPRDWPGITPDGDIITTNPDGSANNHGPYQIYLP